MAKQFKVKHGLVVEEGGASITGSLVLSGPLDLTGNPDSDLATRTEVSLVGKTATGTNWSGSNVLDGYTHTPGSSDRLVTDIAAVANTTYAITYSISGVT